MSAPMCGVKTDLASTKTDLDKTKSDLKKVSGDLGITSGFVATNAKEIEELRRRGEFDHRVLAEETEEPAEGGRYQPAAGEVRSEEEPLHVIVLADDKRVEKKDRTVNEPLQFYVAKSLYEVVVISVGKDQISGYLQTPKYGANR